jgi:hypothetical protein
VMVPPIVLLLSFWVFCLLVLTFSNLTHKTETKDPKRWATNNSKTTNSNPPGPIKPSSQSIIAGVRLCSALCHPQNPLQKKWWAKTILLTKSGGHLTSVLSCVLPITPICDQFWLCLYIIILGT